MASLLQGQQTLLQGQKDIIAFLQSLFLPGAPFTSTQPHTVLIGRIGTKFPHVFSFIFCYAFLFVVALEGIIVECILCSYLLYPNVFFTCTVSMFLS